MLHESFEEYLEMAGALLGSHESLGELQEANTYVNMAIMLRPKDGRAWILKSYILSSLEDDAAALAAAEMATRRLCRNAEAQYAKAAVLADMERDREALRCVERAFKNATPQDTWLLEDLFHLKGCLLLSLGRDEAAMGTFEAGLRLFPDSALLRSGLEPLRRDRIRRNFKVIDGGLP